MSDASSAARIADSRRKVLPAVFSLLFCLTVAWPVFENWSPSPSDDFPLSYYPMFTQKRTGELRINHLVGVDEAGQECPISYRYAGTGGMNQVRKQLRKTVDRGEAARLCEKVARRIVRRDEEDLNRLRFVKIVTTTYQFDDLLGDRAAQPTCRIEAECRIRWNE